MNIGLGIGIPFTRSSLWASIFTPSALFLDGSTQGVWYDPSDNTTLFQDAAGTIPVTAVEQPVGLMLDKSKGLVLGPELVTNGDFSQGATGWTLGSGWSVSGGKLIATSVAFAVEAKQDIATLVAGSRYVVSFDVVVTSGTLKVNLSNYGVSPTELLISASGTYTYRPLQSGTAQITFWASSTFTGSIDNISVKELPGNHAFNPSGNSANFPILKQDEFGKKYLSFNGVNQWLQTNSIDFSYADKMFVCAGVRKLSDAVATTLLELSVTSDSNTGSFYLRAPDAGYPYGFKSRGTANAWAQTSSTYSTPITNVISGIGDISGDQSILRINGTQAAISTSDQGTGSYGNYPLYIGARAGTSLFFNGNLYQLVIAAGSEIRVAEEDSDLFLSESGDFITAETTVAVIQSAIEQTEAFVNRKTSAF